MYATTALDRMVELLDKLNTGGGGAKPTIDPNMLAALRQQAVHHEENEKLREEFIQLSDAADQAAASIKRTTEAQEAARKRAEAIAALEKENEKLREEFIALQEAADKFHDSMVEAKKSIEEREEAEKKANIAKREAEELDLAAMTEATAAREEQRLKETLAQDKLLADRKRRDELEDSVHKSYLQRLLENTSKLGKGTPDLISHFYQVAEGAAKLDEKFAELSAIAGSKAFRDLYGEEAQKKLQTDILRKKAEAPGDEGDLARAQLKKQQEDEATERRRRAFQIGGGISGAVGAIAGGQGPAGGAGGISGALGGIAGLMGGLATPTGGALKFGEALAGSIDKVNKWTEGLHQANMQFAEFSGSMAAISAQAEIHRMQLDRMKGEARSGTARELEQSRYQKERSWAPVENAWANTKNVVGTAWNNFMGGFGQIVSTVLGLNEEEEKPITEKWQDEMRRDMNYNLHRPFRGPRPPAGRFDDV